MGKGDELEWNLEYRDLYCHIRVGGSGGELRTKGYSH